MTSTFFVPLGFTVLLQSQQVLWNSLHGKTFFAVFAQSVQNMLVFC